MNEQPVHIDQTLITRYLASECNAAEQAAVEAWVEQNEANKADFDAWKSLWELAEAPSVASNATPSEEAHLALAVVKQKISQEEVVPESGARSLRRSTWIGVAAGLFILVGAFVLIQLIGTDPAGSTTMLAYETTNQVEAVTLPDGTEVTLNWGSKLEYPEAFDGATRTVQLSGEGFFDVTHNPEQPFIIQTSHTEVQVLGTSFNLNAYPDQEEVVVNVVSGKVKFSDVDEPEDHLILLAGDAAAFTKSSDEVVQLDAFNPASTAWNDETLIFEDTELRVVFEILGEVYDVNITTTSEDILNCRLSTTFKNETIDAILGVLVKTFSLEIQQNGNDYSLHGTGCP